MEQDLQKRERLENMSGDNNMIKQTLLKKLLTPPLSLFTYIVHVPEQNAKGGQLELLLRRIYNPILPYYLIIVSLININYASN